jgi:ABC-type Fe3+/spermidine/putrescine transport system ATPase subunit
MSAVIDARGVGVRIGRRDILKGIDLQLQRGAVTCLIGPNGAGKTTLLETLGGVDQPTSGRIEREGRVAAALQGGALARRTARKNVELALAWWGAAREERSSRALAALELLGVRELADQPGRTLSGGEARRVHLARALSLSPDALLLDEPFAGLDVTARADLLYTAAEVLRAPERATLVVVHDRSEAWALADRVVVMLDGEIAAEGSPSEVFERPPTLEVARFVGFVGTIEEPGAVRVFRPSDVRVDASGEMRGTVKRRVPLEDGVRIELIMERGAVVAVAPPPGPEVGDEVRVALHGGLRYTAEPPL